MPLCRHHIEVLQFGDDAGFQNHPTRRQREADGRVVTDGQTDHAAGPTRARWLRSRPELSAQFSAVG
jgi:hypothetical protein